MPVGSRHDYGNLRIVGLVPQQEPPGVSARYDARLWCAYAGGVYVGAHAAPQLRRYGGQRRLGVIIVIDLSDFEQYCRIQQARFMLLRLKASDQQE